MAAIGEPFLKPGPWRIFLDKLTRGFISFPTDDAQTGPSTLFSPPSPYTATDVTGFQYGSYDWQSASGTVLSCDSYVGRLEYDSANASEYVYTGGSRYARAPADVLAMAQYDASGEQRLIVCVHAPPRYVFYSRPLSALPSVDQSLFEAMTNPTGWRELGSYTFPSDLFSSTYGPVAFNQSGTQARCMLLRNFSPGVFDQLKVHSLRFDVVGDTVTATDEGRRGEGITERNARTVDCRSNTRVGIGAVGTDVDFTSTEVESFSGFQGYLVDFRADVAVYCDIVGSGSESQVNTYVHSVPGGTTQPTELDSLSVSNDTRGLKLQGTGIDITIDTQRRSLNQSLSRINGPVTLYSYNSDGVTEDVLTTVEAVDLRSGFAAWRWNRTFGQSNVSGTDREGVFGGVVSFTNTNYATDEAVHDKGAGDELSGPSVPPPSGPNSGTQPMPAFDITKTCPSEFDNETTQGIYPFVFGGTFINRAFVEARRYLQVDPDGNVFISQPTPSAGNGHFVFLTGGDPVTLAAISAAGDARFIDVGLI